MYYDLKVLKQSLLTWLLFVSCLTITCSPMRKQAVDFLFSEWSTYWKCFGTWFMTKRFFDRFWVIVTKLVSFLNLSSLYLLIAFLKFVVEKSISNVSHIGKRGSAFFNHYVQRWAQHFRLCCHFGVLRIKKSWKRFATQICMVFQQAQNNQHVLHQVSVFTFLRWLSGCANNANKNSIMLCTIFCGRAAKVLFWNPNF